MDTNARLLSDRHTLELAVINFGVEAAVRLPKEFTKSHPDVPWVDIVAFRNISVHEYFSVRWDIVWVAATEEVPVLHDQYETELSWIQQIRRELQEMEAARQWAKF